MCRRTSLRELRSQSAYRIIALKKFIISLIASTAICWAGPSFEVAESSGTLTLRQALALALTRSPELAVVNYDVRIAEARALQARLLPSPELDFTSENVAGSGRYSNARLSENTLLLGVLIELGGKRRMRVSVSSQQVQRGHAIKLLESQSCRGCLRTSAVAAASRVA